MDNGLQAKQQEMMKTYKEEIANGRTTKEAAKIAQQRTGLSIRTGAPIQSKRPKSGMQDGRLAKDLTRVGFGVFGGSR